jgi:hypothetical protein
MAEEPRGDLRPAHAGKQPERHREVHADQDQDELAEHAAVGRQERRGGHELDEDEPDRPQGHEAGQVPHPGPAHLDGQPASDPLPDRGGELVQRLPDPAELLARVGDHQQRRDQLVGAGVGEPVGEPLQRRPQRLLRRQPPGKLGDLRLDRLGRGRRRRHDGLGEPAAGGDRGAQVLHPHRDRLHPRDRGLGGRVAGEHAWQRPAARSGEQGADRPAGRHCDRDRGDRRQPRPDDEAAGRPPHPVVGRPRGGRLDGDAPQGDGEQHHAGGAAGPQQADQGGRAAHGAHQPFGLWNRLGS